VQTVVESILTRALGGAQNMGDDRSMPTIGQPRRASATALRPAPQPRSSTHPLPARRRCSSANVIRTAFGADRANPATVPGVLHGEPARGSMLET
jgi:hypothetical protein